MLTNEGGRGNAFREFNVPFVNHSTPIPMFGDLALLALVALLACFATVDLRRRRLARARRSRAPRSISGNRI